MSLPTQPVTCIAYDQNGNPVVGARFRFRLNSTEIYNGFIAPEMIEVVANSLGVAVANLFPNALGSTGSLYSVRSWNPDTGKRYLDTFLTVPDSPSNLHQILTEQPYPPIDAAQQALSESQAILAQLAPFLPHVSNQAVHLAATLPNAGLFPKVNPAGDGFVYVADAGVTDHALLSNIGTLTHAQLETAITARESTANKGANNGYASLDAGGKVPANQMPNIEGGAF